MIFEWICVDFGVCYMFILFWNGKLIVVCGSIENVFNKVYWVLVYSSVIMLGVLCIYLVLIMFNF